MKAAIVLLADPETQNIARRAVFELNSRYGVPFYASLLPSHVSLKQPFSFEDIDALEGYFDTLAEATPPFEITLKRFYCETWSGYGILGIQVVETRELRAIHNRLNEELKRVVKDPRANFDGEEYRFHMTIEMGKVEGERDPFQAYYQQISRKDFELRFTACELGMFIYDESASPGPGSFTHYRTKPLRGNAKAEKYFGYI